MDWRDRWEWLSGIVLVMFGWLVRRRGRGANGLGRSLADLLNAKRQLEICEAERNYYRRALEEILRITENRYRTFLDQHPTDAPQD